MVVVLGRLTDAQKKRLADAVEDGVEVYAGETEAGEALRGAQIVLTSVGLSEQAVRSAPRLRWVFSTSAGVERFPFDALSECGVRLSNTSGMHGSQMSEQIMGVVIAFDRSLHLAVRRQAAKKWEPSLPAGELDGKTMLIVGAGSIGRALAPKAKAFGMRVLGVRRTPQPLPDFDAVYGTDSLPSLLGEADYVVLLTPLTPETKDFFGRAEFGAMKRSAVFINYSRGGTVDEDALAEALRGGVIAGAGLDVFRREPLPPDSPLWDMENVLITPHMAGVTPDYMGRALEVFIRSLPAWRLGLPLPSEVDLSRRY